MIPDIGYSKFSVPGLIDHEVESPTSADLDELELSANVSTHKPLTCPNCQQTHRLGELTCPNCHTVLTPDGKKNTAGSTDKLPDEEPPIDIVSSISTRKPIVLEIEQSKLVLPDKDSLIIGRINTIGDDLHPDIDLSTFGAEAKGVSRHHLKIARNNALVYITDLGSTNGTFLNGQKVMARVERVLRPGDEVRLGHLKVKVTF